MTNRTYERSSFRDKSGTVFYEDNFVREFGKKFEIVEFDKILDTERTIYYMKNKIDRIKFDRFFEAHEKLKDEGAELSVSKLD